MMLNLLLAAAIGTSPTPAVFADRHRIGRGPSVEVWTNHDEGFRRGGPAPNYDEYSYDVLPYYVEQHYDYPRFLCYDCHAYASYSYWNPYSYSCFRFRIVMYDDYFYYPNRRYAGARFVYRSAPRLAPRYV